MTPRSPSPGTPHGTRAGRTLFWVAAALGIVHATFSAYWAVGGRWLLPTVGSWAVEFASTAPIASGFVLGIVAIAKLAAAVIPLLNEYGHMPARRFWRAISWLGGVGLMIYGGVTAAIGIAVLAGGIATSDGYDKAAMIGHAFLWDPLFFLWGAALTTALALTRPRRRQ